MLGLRFLWIDSGLYLSDEEGGDDLSDSAGIMVEDFEQDDDEGNVGDHDAEGSDSAKDDDDDENGDDDNDGGSGDDDNGSDLESDGKFKCLH